MAFYLWCRKGKVFCEHPFALHRQQPEKDKQKFDVGTLEKVQQTSVQVSSEF